MSYNVNEKRKNVGFHVQTILFSVAIYSLLSILFKHEMQVKIIQQSKCWITLTSVASFDRV